MAKRALPNLALVGNYADSDDGWGADMNASLLKLSALVQGGIIGRVNAVPGGPAQGDVYVLTAAPNNKAVAVYDGGAWTYYQPNEGWLLYDRGADTFIFYDGAAWTVLVAGGGGGGGEPAPSAYRFGGFFIAKPTNAEVLMLHTVTDAITFPADFAGSYFKVLGVNPAAAWVAKVQQNGADIGTISVTTGGVATFATVGHNVVNVAAGDTIAVIGPAVADTAITNGVFSLRSNAVVATGRGIPAGGNTGQVVRKSSGAAFDAAWADIVEHAQSWKGKNIGAHGDSIVAGYGSASGYQWPRLAATALEANYTFDNGDSGDGMKDDQGDLSAGNLANVHLLFVARGTNDWNGGRALGARGDASNANTFYGDVKKVIELVYAANPSLRLVFCTPTQRGADPAAVNGNGVTLAQFAQAIRETCADYALPVLDFYTTSGINTLTRANKTMDNLHPNDEGTIDMGRQAAGFARTI